MGSNPSFVPNVGADGLATDVPIISYTEKVLEEKELKLKQYIQDNYSKIRNVEKELAILALEVKLTAGPKKHALEHLRKMIETSTEKIKAAKLKEEQAKKVWEAAEKAVQVEEAYKQRLCEDLNRLVQESAAAQYTRLEDLTRRIEALNPPPREAATEQMASETNNTSSSQESPVPEAQQPAPSANGAALHLGQRSPTPQGANSNASSVSSTPSSVVSSSTSSSSNSSDSDVQDTRTVGRTQYVTMGQHISMGRGRGRTHGGRSKGALVMQGSKANDAAGWTGAGFNVQDEQ